MTNDVLIADSLRYRYTKLGKSSTFVLYRTDVLDTILPMYTIYGQNIDKIWT